MRIALIGYGKMGRLIEQLAADRGHEVVLKIGRQNKEAQTADALQKADVAIEFTTPDAAFENVMQCLEAGIPVVSGSTGWNAKLEEAKAFCLKRGGAFIHASNFSVGVNIFFQVNELLARLMSDRPEYEVQLTEIHHTQKKDAPSGTAVTLAEQILENLPRKKAWTNSPATEAAQLSIISERVDPAPGTHVVAYHSAVDAIEIKHTAHSRQGFALGALMAAEYIQGRNGVFTMKDVLGFV